MPISYMPPQPRPVPCIGQTIKTEGGDNASGTKKGAAARITHRLARPPSLVVRLPGPTLIFSPPSMLLFWLYMAGGEIETVDMVVFPDSCWLAKGSLASGSEFPKL
jgi:hypothetical protein